MKLTETLQKEYSDIEEVIKREIKQSSHYGIIQSLFEKWIDYITDEKNHDARGDHLISAYHSAKLLLLANSFDYSQGDITTLSIAMPSLRENRDYYWNILELGGMFLSALTNVHYEKTQEKEQYLIITKTFEGQGIFGGEDYTGPNYIGFRNNGATIFVEGNVDENLGKEMNKGKIIVNGNANRNIGISLGNAEIHIKKGCKEIDIGRKVNMIGKIYIDGEIENLHHTEYYGCRKVIHNGITLNKKRDK